MPAAFHITYSALKKPRGEELTFKENRKTVRTELPNFVQRRVELDIYVCIHNAHGGTLTDERDPVSSYVV